MYEWHHPSYLWYNHYNEIIWIQNKLNPDAEAAENQGVDEKKGCSHNLLQSPASPSRSHIDPCSN